eukprot:9499521-Pyramimonas_sp.AAC.1
MVKGTGLAGDKHRKNQGVAQDQATILYTSLPIGGRLVGRFGFALRLSYSHCAHCRGCYIR